VSQTRFQSAFSLFIQKTLVLDFEDFLQELKNCARVSEKPDPAMQLYGVRFFSP
jgi:hypothetical protein